MYNLNFKNCALPSTDHNHNPPDSEVNEKKIKEQLSGAIEKAPTVPLKTLYQENVKNVPPEDNFVPPRYRSVSGNLRRIRIKKLSEAPT